jgi:hypothetical protein
MFAIGSIFYGFTVCLVSTWLASSFYNQGYEVLSALINLIIVSIALGFVAFMKQRMNHPTFNVACSLASISIVSAIVKEGAQYRSGIPYGRFLSLFKIVCAGSGISILICYLIIPSSATKLLKKELNKSCSLMSQYLIQIEKCFINGNNINADELISNLNLELKNNSNKLNKLLDETKYELFLIGKEKEYYNLNELVRSTQFMWMELGGLKGSAEMQWSTLHNDETSSNEHSNGSTRSIKTIDSEEYLAYISSKSASNLTESIDNNNMVALNSSQLFDLFIYYLGPSLKSFCYTIRGVLDGLPFKEGHEGSEMQHYQKSLRKANDLFKIKYGASMKKLYNQELFQQDMNLPLETKINEEEVAASCGNFASILSEFSKELSKFIIQLTEYSEPSIHHKLSWNWLKVWRTYKPNPSASTNTFPDLNYAISTFNTTSQYRPSTTESRSIIFYKLWEFFSYFRKVEVQFSIRVAIGAFFLSSLAYLPVTSGQFTRWRGEWALVTYSIIMNKSLGGTTMTMNWRFLGTFLGCFIAYLSWSLSDGDVFVLFIVGWIMSLLSFNIILNWKDNNAYGRFILLTYNITALYSYNIARSSDDLEEGDDTDPIILDLAIHRFLSITVGVVWALIMTVSFLPMTARGRLKKGLSILWLRLGVIWNTDPLEVQDERLVGLADSIGINSIMRELETLLKQAGKEVRLKGKFRGDLYGKLIKSTEKIIESFQNINTMISIEPKLSKMELYVLNYTKQERDEFTNRIFLIFYMISSCLILGIPMPSKPASIEHSKDRILVKLGEIRKERLLNDEDYVLLYSYVLVANSITNELNHILRLLGDLYGLVDEETFQI